MSVHPTMAPAGSVHRHPAESCGTYGSERARIAADLARNEAKNSGALKRDEVERAHRREVVEGVHQ